MGLNFQALDLNGGKGSALSENLNIKVLLQIMVGIVEFDLTNRLLEVGVPTLTIHGGEDRILSTGYARLLHQKIRGSSLKID